MALNWTTAEAASQNNGIKAMVYGPAGVGKTRLCATAPKPVIGSAEGGLLTYRKMIKDGLLDPATLIAELRDFSEVHEFLEWCRTDARANGYLTVCLDSISEVIEQCLAAEKAKTKDPRQAYGAAATEGIDIIKGFRDLPGMNVLITCKEQKVVDEVTGASHVAPLTPGRQVGVQLPYLFDVVMHAYKGVDKGTEFHAVRVSGNNSVIAKDRSGLLDPVEYPDFNHIINKMQ